MAKAKVLTKDEIKRVMRIADTGNNGLRDKTALALSIFAGARIGEICAMTIGDVRGLDGKAVPLSIPAVRERHRRVSRDSAVVVKHFWSAVCHGQPTPADQPDARFQTPALALG